MKNLQKLLKDAEIKTNTSSCTLTRKQMLPVQKKDYNILIVLVKLFTTKILEGMWVPGVSKGLHRG